MIYETAVVVRADLTEDSVKTLKETVESTIKEFSGEVLIQDDWGVKTFAQSTQSGAKNGKYIYFMYKTANGATNAEIERKYKINEDILRFIVVKCGEDKFMDGIVKTYKNPNTRSAGDEGGRFETDKEKKLFAKKKSCYFSAKKTSPDWKDPSTYSWLVNEFGKISPARITGLRPRFQRLANSAIKRGRNMGLISYVNGNIAK